MKKKLIICLLLFAFSFGTTYAVAYSPENIASFQKKKYHRHLKHPKHRPHPKFHARPHPRHRVHPRHPKHPPLPPHPHRRA